MLVKSLAMLAARRRQSSICKRGICAQQTAILLTEKSKIFRQLFYSSDICSRPWSSSRSRAPAAGMLRTR